MNLPILVIRLLLILLSLAVMLPTNTEVAQNPEAMADLLKQLNDATRQIKELQGKTATYEKANAARAQQTTYEATGDRFGRSTTNDCRDGSVIRHTAIVNAIQGMKDYQFHSARHVF